MNTGPGVHIDFCDVDSFEDASPLLYQDQSIFEHDMHRTLKESTRKQVSPKIASVEEFPTAARIATGLIYKTWQNYKSGIFFV